MSSIGKSTFALAAHVSKAHRQVLIHRAWPELLGDSRNIWLATFLARVANDYHIEARGPEYRGALTSFFVLCAACNVLVSWSTTSGGLQVVWVGVEFLHSTRHFGISQRRAEWFVKWTQETAEWEAIHLISFEKFGRIVYVTGAL